VTSDRPAPPGEPAPPLGGAAAFKPRDEAARQAAADPTRNVVLEASAGTGKTRVLVDRYVRLLRAGVEPSNILAMTFTRKAAAEMRERIVATLRESADRSPEDAARWRNLRDRLNEIAISTIDAFCLSLLREFPLEADLDPGFDVADETEIPRLVEEALDDTLRICRARARTDEGVALLFAQLGEARVREGLAALLERRVVAAQVLDRVTRMGPRGLTIEEACRSGVDRIGGILNAVPGGLETFLAAGPVHHPRYAMLAADMRAISRAAAMGAGPPLDPGRLRGLADRLRAHFFTRGGTPRKRSNDYRSADFASPEAGRSYWPIVTATAPALDDGLRGLKRDLNAILSRAVWQAFSIAGSRYRHVLDARGVLDFSELLVRAIRLVGNMDEFARSRYLLEVRYHHVLVDEFQDTSRAQWELVSLLVRAWGEGLGLAFEAPLPPSIFVVGDSKQSIYQFRDADVRVLDEAAAAIGGLREGDSPLRTISHSFRAGPPLLAFANDLFREVAAPSDRRDAFRYTRDDAFPIEETVADPGEEPALGIVAGDTVRWCAEAVASEIARLASGAQVKDRQSGLRRPVRPGDVGILFRSRASHREFEDALEARRIPSYVYKGLGFFDADEVKDTLALLRYLAEPESDLRAAAFLRSRFVRLSDPGIQRLAPAIARAINGPLPPQALAALDAEDAEVLRRLRASVREWLDLADRIPAAELLDRVLSDSAYEHEIRGPRAVAARENLKKLRGIVRRIQNRGYLTLARLASSLERLSAGDESNAAVDAVDAVNLMTVHAAKGLEFPIVFVVNLSRGSGGRPAPIRIAADAAPEDAVAVGDFESEFDEDAAAREREETRRLFYVAVTRARDRLCLASVTENGAFKPRRGSLGEVLPKSFREMFSAAAGIQAEGVTTVWRSTAGVPHAFRVCLPLPRPAGDQPAPVGGALDHHSPGDRAEGGLDDFAAVADPGARPRMAVTAAGDEEAAQDRSDRDTAGRGTGVMLGRVVHRMFQRSARGDADGLSLAEMARTLIREDEAAAAGDAGALAREAAGVFARMWGKPEVQSILTGADCLYEIPVSLTRTYEGGAAEGRILRGVIDCIVRRPDGRVIVLDFKTGAERRSDRRQLEAYVQAARDLYPGASVEGRLIYV
jgi:ATP-dependent helicase/nuclease subunit A